MPRLNTIVFGKGCLGCVKHVELYFLTELKYLVLEESALLNASITLRSRVVAVV